MTGTTRLLLIRHGQPEQEQARGRCYGALDIELSSEGRRQAERLAAALAAAELVAVYSSPRRRAAETAAAVARPYGLEPVVDSDLCELDFGECEGRTYDEIASTLPALYRDWMESPTTVTFPGGESYADVRRRSLQALTRVRDAHAGSTAAIVTHGGVIRAILATCLEMPDEALFRLDQDYGAINVVDWLDGTPVVRLVNGSALAGA